MVVGRNDKTSLLLYVLKLDPAIIPRFRDIYLTPTSICVYTRTGGGNREWYDSKNENNPEGPWNSTLREHPLFVTDYDDEFDSTYATFEFSFPVEYADDLKALAESNPDVKPSDKMLAAIESLKKVTPK